MPRLLADSITIFDLICKITLIEREFNQMGKRVKDLLGAMQEQLSATLNSTRKVVVHPVGSGDASENSWITLLAAQLPYRYQVGKVFVIDWKGQDGEQTDVVIYDRQYTPLIFNSQGQQFVPAESVYAVFEVKQNLNKKHLEAAAQKVASVRKLARTRAKIFHATGVAKPRPLHHILGGILTTESDWTPLQGKTLTDNLKALPREGRLDLGCAVSSGAFEVNYKAKGIIDVQSYHSSVALLSFFFTLLSRLQAIGTVPAIDYRKYMQVIHDKSI
jgi:hypothetical protein